MRELKNNSVILSAFGLLEKKDKFRTLQVILIQIGLAILDLVGVGIIGALGALTISSATSKGPGDRVTLLLAKLGLLDSSIQQQALILGTTAAFFLVSKTIISMVLLKRTNQYLARRGARLSADLIDSVLRFPMLRLRQQSLMKWQFQLTLAVDVISVGIITTTILMISDLTLLIVLGIGLLYIEPSIALGALILFAGSALIVYRRQHQQSLTVGSRIASISVQTNESLQLVFDSYRDLFVRSSLQSYSKRIRKLRMEAADLSALRSYMPYVGKFTLEITMVIGFLFIASTQFALNEASRAVANIAIFFVASARISPAVLRIQQGLLLIRTNRGQAESALELIDEVRQTRLSGTEVSSRSDLKFEHEKLDLKVEDVDFKYPNNDAFQLKNVSFKVLPGESVAIIGSSGSGKSTIVDLILGLIEPTSGNLTINDKRPAEIHRFSPGTVSFVPQRVVIANKSIKENLAIGFEELDIPDVFYWEALSKAQLDEFVDQLPNKIETRIGAGGIELSGGQVQRLGLARALLTRPSLLVLDEATSALDGKTEFLVTEALDSLKGLLSLVVIAHRLSTINKFDKIIYLKEGSVVDQGNFAYLIGKYPDLAEQAELMKL